MHLKILIGGPLLMAYDKELRLRCALCIDVAIRSQSIMQLGMSLLLFTPFKSSPFSFESRF